MPQFVLKHGDCIDFLSGMEDKSVDAIVTDPPYGNNTDYSTYKDTPENLARLVHRFMPHALRVAKTVIVTPGVANLWLYPRPTWTLAWVNPAGVGSSAWGFSCWQPILAYGKDPYLSDGAGRRPDILLQQFNQVDENEHPCPKPTNVMRWIIERCVPQGGSVLDPFMGSGTTGVACMNLGRDFTGIEMDEKYVEIARERILFAAAQPLLL
jgi:DNA modification methylase